jgi:hypothetical protein
MAERDTLTIIFGLLLSAFVAGGAVFAFLRYSQKSAIHAATGIVQGYPAQAYPLQQATSTVQLQALTAVQQRLLLIYDQAPARSDLTIWLKLFLVELRAIMDVAYRVAPLMQLYGKNQQLDQLVLEVQLIETQIAECSISSLLQQAPDQQLNMLESRLATLRLCTKQLGETVGTQP